MDLRQAERIARVSPYPVEQIVSLAGLLDLAGCPAAEADRLAEQIAMVDHRPFTLPQMALVIYLIIKEGERT